MSQAPQQGQAPQMAAPEEQMGALGDMG